MVTPFARAATGAGHRAARRHLPVLVALALLLVGGCAQAPRTTLRFGLQSMPVTLDPRFATDAASQRVDRLLYQSLVDFDSHSRPVPALAAWRRVDGRHYRFTLRGPLPHFQNGRTLTAADVKATFDSVLDPATASPLRASLNGVQRIAAPDARTVDFYLQAPDPLFPGKVDIGILPAPSLAAGHRFDRSPMGSGPFAFAAWPDDGRLRLRRVSDGQLVEFDYVPNPTMRVLKLLRGEIDMLENDLPFEMVGYLAQRPGIHVLRHRGTNFTYLGFNMQDPVSGDLRVRRAIAYALDRADIVKYLFDGAARPANAILPPDHWAGAPGLQGYAYDPDKARALLRAAGYGPSHPARLVYKTSNDPFRVRLATVVQAQLRRVGVAVDVRSYDWGTFYGDIKAGRFQMYSLSWVGIKSPDILRVAFDSDAVPPAGANRGRFSDAAVDRLIDAAARTPDEAEAARDYRLVQRRLLEELPYIPLWYEDHVYAARDAVTGYTMAADGNYDGLANVHWVK